MRLNVRQASHTVGAAVLALTLATYGAAAQNPVHAHIGHAADAFRGTPDGMGLLPTAIAEAEVAHQHATLAGRDLSSLEGMQRHMAHVIHALDAGRVEGGPGLGYGMIPASERAAQHTELAAASEGASDAVKTHSVHVATAARSAAAHAERAIEVAERIQEAETAEEAAAMLNELTALMDAALNGLDADENGRISWQDGEGGLAQANTHMGLIRQAEGIGS
ncbi:MAG: hypothetical protein ACPHWZ_02665 [Longimicrobiales bacterium]